MEIFSGRGAAGERGWTDSCRWIMRPRIVGEKSLEERGDSKILNALSMASVLEVLHGALMFLRGATCRKGPQIPALASFWINLPRIQPVFAGSQFANHERTSLSGGSPSLTSGWFVIG